MKPVIKLSQIKDKIPYKYSKDDKFGLHIGQRKLLLSEVQFLTNTCEEYCFYAGSAPSNKTHLLSTLFPNVKFILIDPNIFEIFVNNKSHRHMEHPDIIHMFYNYPTKSNKYKINKKITNMTKKEQGEMLSFIKKSKHRIFIWEDFVSDEVCRVFKGLKCTFISDIRSTLEGNKNPKDVDVVWNRSMVHNWIHILRPEISMVKFRVPYYLHKSSFKKHKKIYSEAFKTSKKYGVDFEKNYFQQRFCMSRATLYIQAWKGDDSAEMRGYIHKKDIDNIVEYDTKNIEDRIFYYNTINRGSFHENNNSSKKLHFCHCNDCAIENNIWENYTKKYGGNVHKLVKLANQATHRPLHKIHKRNIFKKK